MENLKNIFQVNKNGLEEEKNISSLKNEEPGNFIQIGNLMKIKNNIDLSISEKYLLNKKRFTKLCEEKNKYKDKNKNKDKDLCKDKDYDKDNNQDKDNEKDKDVNKDKENNGNSYSKKFFNGRWTEEEHNLFIDNIIIYGNNWKKVNKLNFKLNSNK
jgi:hypothetical protein